MDNQSKNAGNTRKYWEIFIISMVCNTSIHRFKSGLRLYKESERSGSFFVVSAVKINPLLCRGVPKQL